MAKTKMAAERILAQSMLNKQTTYKSPEQRSNDIHTTVRKNKED